MWPVIIFSAGLLGGGAALGCMLMGDNQVSQMWDHYMTRTRYDAERKCYEIPYTWGGKKYLAVVPNKRGPRRVYAWKTADDIDVSLSILPRMGKSGDFHQIPTTPRMLGFPNGLTRTDITFGEEDESEFILGDEVIQM